jgi:post-segregation antitoxin (ccd killing protein)
MVKMTVYVPDDLAAEVKAELGESNLSGICQRALRDELDRTRARARARSEIEARSYERIKVIQDRNRGHDVVFQGCQIGHETFGTDGEVTAYVTPKGAIAVHHDMQSGECLDTYDDFSEFLDDLRNTWTDPGDIIRQVADALGEEYVEELDI